MRKLTLAVNVIAGTTMGFWTMTQSMTDTPSPYLDALLVATMGAAVAQSTMAHREKSPPPTEDAEVARTPDQDRSEAAARGVFYCQAGDHIVDSVVWLETITLGCRPCMEKLGLAISTETWMPRLWVVGSDGIKRAEDIPRPKPKASTPKTTSRGTALSYVRKHQDWTCAECYHSFDNAHQGFYNTARGFICKNCSGTVQMDQSKMTRNQLLAKAAEERQRRIVRRKAEQIEESKAQAIRKSMHERVQAMQPARHIAEAGTGKSVRLAEVAQGQHVSVTGTGSSIIIDGDVGSEATVVATGTGCSIMIQGHVHRGATVQATGTGCVLSYSTREEYSQVQAHGTGAVVQGKVENRDQAQQAAREALAQKYDLPYASDWLDAKISMAPMVEQLREKMYVCTCARCGKRDEDNPVLGGAAALDKDYKCLDCMKLASSLDTRVPSFRRDQLAGIKGLVVIPNMDSINLCVGSSYVYVINTDQLFKRYQGSGWTQVPLLAKKVASEIKTPDHQHVWMDLWDGRGKFCKQCGVRA